MKGCPATTITTTTVHYNAAIIREQFLTKKNFLLLRLRDTKSTKSLLELTAKLFLSKAQRWFLQYFWPLLGLSGWPSAMQSSKKKIILQ